MKVVLVSWAIREDADKQFERDFPPLPSGTPGLDREDLYQLVRGPGDGVSRFVRIGRWESEDHFYKALAHLGVAPNTKAKRMPYEVEDRRREWLHLLRDDTAGATTTADE